MNARKMHLVEKLESRQFLAGDVAVAYNAATNTISVEGDSAANQLLISGNLGVGYDITGLTGTTVNGKTTVHLNTTAGARANFDVELGSGNDAVEFNNFAALAVDVSGGSGNDTVKFFNVTAFNGIDVSGASGNDTVSLDYVDIYKGLTITGASGNDKVVFGNTLTGVSLFSGNAIINGASGNDSVTGKANLHASLSTQKIKYNQIDSLT